MPLLSIIIPAYNAGTTLSRAAESICNDKTPEIEVILIDDGSTDNTPALCDELAASDERIHVLHTENSGQGIARNRGMALARGKYIAFCDADDVVMLDGLFKLIDKADEIGADIVCGSYCRNDGKSIERIHSELPSGRVEWSDDRHSLYHRIKTESLFGYIFNKVYRREWMEREKIAFNDVKRFFMEDTLFNLKAYAHNPVYYYLNEPVYVYTTNNVSTVRSPNLKIAEQMSATLDEYRDYLDAIGAYERQTELFVPLAMRMFCYSFVKNRPYEKPNFRGIKRQFGIFRGCRAFNAMLGDKIGSRDLRYLPYASQRWFFGLSYNMLRWHADNLLAFGFLICGPLMERYIKAMVK